MPSSAPTERERAVVAGLQWGLTQAFVLGSLATLLDDYYRATTSRLFPPDWVFSVVAAVPLAFAIGGVMGYRWVANGQATSGSRAHRARVTFTGTVLVGWALAIVPKIGMRVVLGDRLHTAPWFLLPSLVPVVVLGGAAYLGYRRDSDWYGHHRERLLGTVQGALTGLLTGIFLITIAGTYLTATLNSVSLDGGLIVVGCTILGALAGYALADRIDAGDRGPEFCTLLLLSSLLLSSVGVVLMAGLVAVGSSTPMLGVVPFYPAVPISLAFAMTVYLTYGARTDVYARLIGRRPTGA